MVHSTEILRPADIDLERQIVLTTASTCIGRYGDDSIIISALGPQPVKGSWVSLLKVPFIWRKQGISTCGLMVRGWYRLAGVDWPSLYTPYEPGKVFSELIQMARTHGAWVPANVGLLPSPADAIVMGQGAKTHIALFEDWTCRDTLRYISIDGGQEHPVTKLQAVFRIERNWDAIKPIGHIRYVCLPKRKTMQLWESVPT